MGTNDMSAECDRSLYLSDSFTQAYQRCLQEGFSQGGGYVRDSVNAMSAWSFALENITIPVDLWYDGLDTSPVHSPDFSVTLAAHLPRLPISLILMREAPFCGRDRTIFYQS
ncbi:hypothetical protein [Leptolyngbya sp. FACHB-711]|uniref:hypothetical protein n=1 Tax=unclassified Leptolyngbya TaxID=2650499 RepID=UPI00168957C1|nr:hypothetical protein [Leptolyngbya sp. FACHB-711]MBD1851710.1 hypothetical protein [Cyanobacteria bacterium FACHB-502]MBD2025341.1 hypothetical protein [Leptolyngbya sp. FACHB-711]